MPWPTPPRPTAPMRTLGTRLPSTQTVHERVFGGLGKGRPIVIQPADVKLGKDKSKPVGYKLFLQKMKPDVIERVEGQMGTYMPPGLAPQALSYVNTRQHRREH